VARPQGVKPGRPRDEAPPRAAGDEPDENEGDPPRRGGEHQHHHQGDQSDGRSYGNQETGTDHSRLSNRTRPPTRARQEDAAVPREVGEQPRKVTVGSGTQRSVYPLLKLVRLQPALAGRLAQPVDDRVAVGIRRP